jgi:hypothetical protein
MKPLDAGSIVCPMCSAENSLGAARCFLCGQSLSGATEFVPSKPSSGPTAGRRPTFQITSIMLLIALIAVFLGVFHEAPGLAMLLVVPGTIALLRTLVVSGDRPGPHSWFDHVAVFLGTFAAVITVAVAAGVSFFVSCLAFGTGANNFGVGLVGGGIVGVGVLVGLTAAFVRWSRRSRLR